MMRARTCISSALSCSEYLRPFVILLDFSGIFPHADQIDLLKTEGILDTLKPHCKLGSRARGAYLYDTPQVISKHRLVSHPQCLPQSYLLLRLNVCWLLNKTSPQVSPTSRKISRRPGVLLSQSSRSSRKRLRRLDPRCVHSHTHPIRLVNAL